MNQPDSGTKSDSLTNRTKIPETIYMLRISYFSTKICEHGEKPTQWMILVQPDKHIPMSEIQTCLIPHIKAKSVTLGVGHIGELFVLQT